MSSAQGGFGNAPVSKTICLTSAIASILSQASRASSSSRGGNPKGVAPLPSLGSALVFHSPGDLLFGSFLIYYFRVLERQQGSAKFGAFVCVTVSVSWALQQVAGALLRLPPAASSSSPPLYGLIFASFVQFFFNVPALSKFSVLGWQLSNKAFIYLAGLQLCLSGGVRSMVAAGAGLVAGALYRANLLGMRQWRIPAVISRVLQNSLGRFLETPQPQPAQVPDRGTLRRPAQEQRRHVGRPAGRGAIGARDVRDVGQAAGDGAPPWEPAAAIPVSQEALEQLVAMGFEPGAASTALQAVNNDVQAAISLLL